MMAVKRWKSCEMIQSYGVETEKYEKLDKVMVLKQKSIPFYYKLQE